MIFKRCRHRTSTEKPLWGGGIRKQRCLSAMPLAWGVLGSSRLLFCSATELAAWSALMAPMAADWDRFAVITAGAGLGLALVDRSKAT